MVQAARIHPIKIPFEIPIAPDRRVPRFVYVYLIEGARLVLIDTGVAGAETVIEARIRELGRTVSDLEVILLTHAHPDHIGAGRGAAGTERRAGMGPRGGAGVDRRRGEAKA